MQIVIFSQFCRHPVIRNRLMLELMAQGGMRVGEVLNLTPADIQGRTLAIKNPKSGRVGEAVYVPRKLLVRLTNYLKDHDIANYVRIFPISYVAAWSMVKNSGLDFPGENLSMPKDVAKHFLELLNIIWFGDGPAKSVFTII